MTVTRVAGSTGRATVDYSTEDGTYYGGFNDIPAYAGEDYEPVSGTLVFDDYEMSKTILIPIIDNSGNSSGIGLGGSGGNLYNKVFSVVLSNPQLDPLESGDVSPPRVDPSFTTAEVKILNSAADPYGPTTFRWGEDHQHGHWNVECYFGRRYQCVTVTNSVTFTNYVIAASPTNAIFNFERRIIACLWT